MQNLYLYGLICTSPRRIVPSGKDLQDLEGQIRAETTSRHPHQLEEARRADVPHRTRTAANGTTVLGPTGRQVLDQGARSNGDPDRRTHPALAGREHLSHGSPSKPSFAASAVAISLTPATTSVSTCHSPCWNHNADYPWPAEVAGTPDFRGRPPVAARVIQCPVVPSVTDSAAASAGRRANLPVYQGEFIHELSERKKRLPLMSPTGWRILAIVAFVVYPFAISGLAAWIVRWSGRQKLCKRGGALFTVIGCVATAWFIITNGLGMMPVVTIVGSAVFVFGMASTGALVGALAESFIAHVFAPERSSRQILVKPIAENADPFRASAPKHAVRFSIRELLLAIAAVAFTLGGFTIYGLPGASSVALTIGALLIIHGRRVKRRWVTRTGIAISLGSLCTLGLLLAGWLLFGIGPVYSSAAYPHEFTRMVNTANAETKGAKIAGLGSFIDTEHVWRLTLSSDQLDRVVSEYGLVPVAADDVPQSFWQAFPRWWGPTHNKHCRYLSTPNFPVQSRGPDGDHCFTVYDSQTRRFYVWYKFNF